MGIAPFLILGNKKSAGSAHTAKPAENNLSVLIEKR